MDKTRRSVVFLDTNVLISAFAPYRNGSKLPFYLTDPEASRFTFEKCIFEAYMTFRGVAKECPKKEKTGRGEKKGPVKWAERYLDKDKDARTLNDLINKYHKQFDGNFWINNISGNEQLINYCEEMMNEPKSASAYEILSRELQILKGLIKNRDLFEKLCKEFNKMLLDNKVCILRYEDIFCIKEDRLADRATDDLLWIRDAFGREIIIPSEDFEIVYAAMRLRADIFVTDEDAILEHSPSFGLNLPLSAASFCRGNRKKANTDNDDKSKEKEKNRYMTYDEKVKEWRLINADNCN